MDLARSIFNNIRPKPSWRNSWFNREHHRGNLCADCGCFVHNQPLTSIPFWSTVSHQEAVLFIGLCLFSVCPAHRQFYLQLSVIIIILIIMKFLSLLLRLHFQSSEDIRYFQQKYGVLTAENHRNRQSCQLAGFRIDTPGTLGNIQRNKT